jgi:hypothetical protein
MAIADVSSFDLKAHQMAWRSQLGGIFSDANAGSFGGVQDV